VSPSSNSISNSNNSNSSSVKLRAYQSVAVAAIMSPGVYPEVQSAWDDLRQARAALRAAVAAAGEQSPSQQQQA
jgi:hypothetical protein